jgi:hypothetical protein
LLVLLRTAAALFAGPAGTALRGLLSDALRDPALAAQYCAYTRGNSLRAMREVVRRAGERGELAAESITALQLETGMALMRSHFLTHDGPVPDEVLVGIVDEVVLPLFHAASRNA